MNSNCGRNSCNSCGCHSIENGRGSCGYVMWYENLLSGNRKGWEETVEASSS